MNTDAQQSARGRQLALYGMLAEFDDEDALLGAARRAYAVGYRQMDAFTPFPVEGLTEALGHQPRSALKLLVLAALAVGAAVGFGLQYFATSVAYPLNVGGRPLNSLPAFLPLAFELMILFAALVVFAGMLWLTGLPAKHRALRNVPHFDLATRDRFFLAIFSADGQFDRERTRRFLESLNPLEVNVVRS